ncbi:MAG: hypothetical protein JWR26_1649 [Pedosphaera sp.]|nr:hypothetical protein [Pedosphaera sp.]
MTKRRFLFIAIACLVALEAIWLALPAGAPKTDEAKYQKWIHTSRLAFRVTWWERRLPHKLFSLLHLSALQQSYWDEHEALGDALTASHFLEISHILVGTNPITPIQRTQIAARLKAIKGGGSWEFWTSSNAVVVIARPQEIILCKQALQE